MPKLLNERQAAERNTWQYKAVEATRGNQSRLGCILLAVLGRPAKHPPQFGSSATITSDGFVMADFVGRDGRGHMGARVCGADELRDNFRGLADHLKLDDANREAMFKAVRQWIAVDYRANKEGI
jgi:hypothetical protein